MILCIFLFRALCTHQRPIIYYHTRLELVRSGPIRVEETKQIKVDYIGRVIEGEAVPLYNILPPPPKKRVVNSLYPKDKDRNRIRKKKNIQFSLPLSQTEQRLQEISIESGDPTIYSMEELLSGKEGWYSLEQNRTIKLPKAILTLLKDFNCSLPECEAIASLSGVLKPQDLLFWVEQIPQMRKMPELKTFQEPAPVTNIDRHTTTTTIQTQTLKSQTEENY